MHKLFLPILFLVSCNNTSRPNLATASEEILAMEDAQRTFHFEKNAKAFTDLFSDDFISINDGIVEQPDRWKSFDMFESYFKSVDIIKWENKKPPVIRFSNDASIAYAAVEKFVVIRAPGKNGRIVMDTSHFAWVTVYKRTAEGWRIDCVTSTNK